MSARWRRLTASLALLVGLVLFAIALRHADTAAIADLPRRFGSAWPLLLAPGAAWHLLRTIAWRRCFPRGTAVPFATIARVRLYAEAFSYVTVSGVGGEPLKVLLLAPAVAPAVSAAAIALERVAYLVVTAAMLGVSAAVAVATLPMTAAWTRAFTWIAAGATLVAIVPLVVLQRRRRRSIATTPAVSARPAGRVRRFLGEFLRHFRDLATMQRREMAILVALEAAAFVAMALEVWTVMLLARTPVTLAGSMAIETFTRVASMVFAFIPANLGALEVSNVAAASALHVAGGAVALAVVRRVRGIVWCAAGFCLYPRASHRRGAPDAPASGAADATLIAIQTGDSDAMVRQRLGGMPVGERIARAASRAGYDRLLVWTEPHREAEWRGAPRGGGGRIDVVATGDLDVWRAHWDLVDPDSPVTVLGPAVVAPPQVLARARGTSAADDHPMDEVAADDASLETGVYRARRRELDTPAAVGRALLAGRRATATVATTASANLTLNVSTPAEVADAERRLRRSIFKSTDGKLARLNRR